MNIRASDEVLDRLRVFANFKCFEIAEMDCVTEILSRKFRLKIKTEVQTEISDRNFRMKVANLRTRAIEGKLVPNLAVLQAGAATKCPKHHSHIGSSYANNGLPLVCHLFAPIKPSAFETVSLLIRREL